MCIQKLLFPKVLVSSIALGFMLSCSVDPFVDITPNGSGVALEHADLLTQTDKKELLQHVQKNTYYDAVTVIKDGKLLLNYGDYQLPMNCASARKSIFSMLYGIAIDKGLVDIDRSLEYYGIDDSKQPLTAAERKATIRQLLQARSGIYVKALGESEGMKRRKPQRGAYLPGEHFYYNNFDFNVLPIILEKLTAKKLGDLIYEWLAVPTGMMYFKPEHVQYEYANYTDFPQTRVYMNSEDLARLGMLMVQNGSWAGQQLISPAWVNVSTTAVSIAPNDKDLEGFVCQGYAYLWWVDLEANTFWANGAYGQFMIVDRDNNLVLVLRNNSGLNPIGIVENVLKNEYEDEASAKELYEMLITKIQLK